MAVLETPRLYGCFASCERLNHQMNEGCGMSKVEERKKDSFLSYFSFCVCTTMLSLGLEEFST